MTLSQPKVRSSRATWGATVVPLASGVCGLIIMVSPETPALVRLLGGAIALFAAVAGRWKSNTRIVPPAAVAGHAAAADSRRGVPETGHASSPQDKQTEMTRAQ